MEPMENNRKRSYISVQGTSERVEVRIFREGIGSSGAHLPVFKHQESLNKKESNPTDTTAASLIFN